MRAAIAVVAVWSTVCLVEEAKFHLRRRRALRARVAARRAVFASRGAR